MSAAILDKDLYDETANSWWSDDKRWVRTLKNMVPARLAFFDRFIDWSGKNVLDLGCAGGFMSEALHERGAKVTGIDPAGKAIGAARQHAKIQDYAINYLTGAGEHLPFPDAHFDAVVCVDVLEHVLDLDQTVGEIARTLKPDGQFLFDTINRNPLARMVTITMAENVLGLLPRGTHDHRKFIKPEELRTIMRRHNLRPGQSSGLGPTGLNRRGDFTFGRLPMQGIIYMGEARKEIRP